jgi:hypothetical protein
MITKFDYSSLVPTYEEFEQNRKRRSRIADEVRGECFLCGRDVNETTAKYVHLSTAGGLIPVSAGTPTDSQGWFPVGSECVKQIPSAYVKKGN